MLPPLGPSPLGPSACSFELQPAVVSPRPAATPEVAARARSCRRFIRKASIVMWCSFSSACSEQALAGGPAGQPIGAEQQYQGGDGLEYADSRGVGELRNAGLQSNFVDVGIGGLGYA